MANPGSFPPMGPPMGGPMQPMGGPPMGGPPMGPMGPMGMGGMPRPPMQHRMSRIVPVVVSAGLAVGVFCGLLFGFGTGKRSASAQLPKASNGVKRADDAFVPESQANPNVKIPDKNAPRIVSNPGSAVGAVGGAATGGSAASPAPASKSSRLVVEIKPDAVAQTAKISVDGKEITGTFAEIDLDPGMTRKKVKVVVKAAGFKDVEQDIDVEGESTTLKLEITKPRPAPPATAAGTGDGDGGAAGRSGGTTTGGTGGKATGTTKPATGAKGKGKGSGGLIDI